MKRLFLGEFGLWVIVAFKHPATVASFFHHVGGVILGRPQEQLRRFTTNRVIAFMQNFEAVSYGAFKKLVRKTMRKMGISSAMKKMSIAKIVFNPAPAPAAFVN